MRKGRKTFVIALDGTLCITPTKRNQHNDYEFQYMDANPIYSRIERVNQLYEEGNRIIIETSRNCGVGSEGSYDTVKQLRNWGVKYNTLRESERSTADVYISDRSIGASDFFEESTRESDMLSSIIENESGSGIRTKVVLVNRVLKEATDERMEKLVDEINFLECIPDKFKQHFPQIIKSGQSDNNRVFYEMEHFNLPTIRRLILSERINDSDLIYWSDKVIDFSLKMHNHEIIKMPEDYLDFMHYDRLYRRFNELKRKSPVLKKLLSLTEIHINGKKYKNIPGLFEKLNSKKIRNSVNPEFVGRLSHSDLHYSNILIDQKNDNFILIDPRGYPFCDYYYDYGKLWHSVNGKYELISAELFKLEVESKFRFNCRFTNDRIVETLRKTKSKLPDILYKYSNESKDDVIRKTEFNECMHFASLVPFLLKYDGKEDRAVVAYLTATVLNNEFLEKYY